MLWGEISPCHENGAWDGIGMITFGILQCLAPLRQWAIFSTHSTSWGNSCKCRYSWLHVQPLESLETTETSGQILSKFISPTKIKNYPTTPSAIDAMCNMPCLQQSHQKPWRPFGTGEANIQGIQVLHGGVPHGNSLKFEGNWSNFSWWFQSNLFQRCFQKKSHLF